MQGIPFLLVWFWLAKLAGRMQKGRKVRFRNSAAVRILPSVLFLAALLALPRPLRLPRRGVRTSV